MITAIIYMLFGALMLTLISGAGKAITRIREEQRRRWRREGAKMQREAMINAGWTASDWTSNSAYELYA